MKKEEKQNQEFVEHNEKKEKRVIEKRNDFKTYLKLFTSTFYLSAFTFGGGFVIISLMKKKFVDELHWIDEDEMLDLTAIAQSSPGAIAVNASIMLGYRIAGVIGTIVCIIGTILPPLIILSIVSLFYEAFKTNLVVAALLKGMQSGVAAVICDVVLTLGGNVVKTKKIVPVIIMITAFVLTYFLKINVMWIILGCAVIGALSAFYEKKKGKSLV